MAETDIGETSFQGGHVNRPRLPEPAMSRSTAHLCSDPSWMYRSEAFAEDLPMAPGVVRFAPTGSEPKARRSLRAIGWYAATVALALLAAWPAASRWA
jgi:hypothetical protein